MAHRILGVDVGAYSLKAAELEAGFRTSKLIGLYEHALLPAEAGESDLVRAARTLQALLLKERLAPEMFATSMGGEATLRLLTMPFSDPKKIEQVLPFELESHILGDLGDLVIDYVMSGSVGDETHVIAVAAERARVRELIDALQAVGAEPRVIGASALSYAALRGHAFVGDERPLIIVDMGHRRTNVCVMREGVVLFARSIPRGGEEVTTAIAEAYKMEPAAAQTAKHEQAFINQVGMPLDSPAHRAVDACVREAIRPLIRDLRQTLAAYRAIGDAPARLYLTGGAARLRGMAAHLEVELRLEVAPLELFENDEFVALAPSARTLASGAMPAQAIGLALAAAAPVPQVNLRKGDLAYRSDYSYLRGKGVFLVASVLAILAFATINAAASLRGLRKEGDALETRLKQQTQELFGQPMTDGKAVSEELKGGPKGGAPPIPSFTAYDVLDEISRHVPPADKVKLDILELDIKPKKTYLKGTVESAQQLDELATELGKIECFEEPQKGKVSTVTSPPSGDNAKGEKASELKQFTLTINTTCP